MAQTKTSDLKPIKSHYTDQKYTEICPKAVTDLCEHKKRHARYVWCTRKIKGLIVPCSPENMSTDKTEMK